MKLRRIVVTALTLAVGLLFPTGASAAEPPRWQLESIANTAAAPGSSTSYFLYVRNTGDEPTTPAGCPGSGCQKLEIELPPGMEVGAVSDFPSGEVWVCQVLDSRHAECVTEDPILPVQKAKNSGNPRIVLTVTVRADASGTEIAELSLSGGGAPAVTVHDPTQIGPEPPFGFDALDVAVLDETGQHSTAAGKHPQEMTTWLDFNRGEHSRYGNLWPIEPLRDSELDLPPGLLGNPQTVDECTASELENNVNQFTPVPLCPLGSQVGLVTIQTKQRITPEFPSSFGPMSVYNMVPPPGAAARFGFNMLGSVVVLDAKVRGGSDYGITVSGSNVPEALAIFGAHFEFWGVPADPARDPWRNCPGEMYPFQGFPTCDAQGAPLAAFFRTPTACTDAGGSLPVRARADSWKKPGLWTEDTIALHHEPGYPYPRSEWGPPVEIEDCGNVPFTPTISAEPTTTQADSPSGLEVDLTIPQDEIADPEAVAQSDLKRAQVVLPAGMSVNPSAANGRVACSSAQIGLLGTNFPAPAPIRFTNQAPSCPDSSKIGEVEIDSPLLDHTIKAGVFMAAPQDNPFGSLLGMYVAGRDAESGVVLKLPARVDADPVTGQLTTTFDNQPQLPFEEFRMTLYGGPRAVLRTPSGCGSYAIDATLAPWSGTAPVAQQSSFEITQGPNGTPCPTGAFQPSFSAGTEEPLAGAFSPFSVRFGRADGTPQLGSLDITLPQGLLAKLAGVPYCPDAALAAVSGAIGGGNAQIAAPSCPSASQIGKVAVVSGAGPSPVYVDSGRAYLAGPYKGAPLSIAVITPAVAGPFDLGATVVRNALYLDPVTSATRVVSDPLPTILHGIPLNLRDVRIRLDRQQFTVNPTSCEAAAIGGSIASAHGAVANVSNRFQVGNCAALAFKPKLTIRLKGKTRRGGNPSLRAMLKMPAGNANISRAAVALPPSAFLDQEHLDKICTRVQYAAGGGGGEQCPKGSAYGYARAWTPLLDKPLQGPVFLRSSDNLLPDLVASLSGQIHIDLVGRIDTDKRNGIRTTFDFVPDAPVSKFVLRMKGGRYSLLENSENICRGEHRAGVSFRAHNGRAARLRPLVEPKCGKQRGGKRRPSHR